MKNKWLLLSLIVWITLIFDDIKIVSITFIACFLILKNEKNTLLLYLILIFITSFNVNPEIITNGYIKTIKENYVVVEDGFKKGIVFTDGYKFRYHDYVLVSDERLLTSTLSNYGFDSEKYYHNMNIYYSYKTIELIESKQSIKNKLFDYVLNIDNEIVRSLYLKILFNINDQNLSDIFYLTGFYYASFITLIHKILGYFIDKKYLRYIDIGIIFIIGLIFGFQYIVWRLLFNKLLNLFKISKLDKQGFKILFTCLLFKGHILNLEFVLPTIFGLYHIFRNKQFGQKLFYLMLIQLFYFKSCNLFISIINPLLFKLYGLIYIILLICLPFPTCTLFIISLFDSIDKFSNYSLFIFKGYPSLIMLIIILIIHFIYHKYFFNLISIILCITLGLNHPFMSITYINVKQGDAILIHGSFNRYNVLIDTGSNKNYSLLKSYLDGKGVEKIDYLIITHNDEDHNGNISNLKKDYQINHIIQEHKDVTMNNLKLYSLNKEYENDNDNSLVYYTSINDLVFIFTGDISNEVEKDLASKYNLLPCDILKLAHHGSKTSTSEAFINLTRPKIGIISSGTTYNHPSKEVIQRLLINHIYYLDTKEVGDIEIYLTRYLNFFKTSNMIIGLIEKKD